MTKLNGGITLSPPQNGRNQLPMQPRVVVFYLKRALTWEKWLIINDIFFKRGLKYFFHGLNLKINFSERQISLIYIYIHVGLPIKF